MTPKTPLIQLKNLTKSFFAGDSEIKILHSLDLTLYQGEMVAIIGQSGSGKSTLMNILGCLDRPTSGTYCINGRLVGDMNKEEIAALRREQFGFIFQKYHLLGDITALDNVCIPAVYAGADTNERNKRAKELLTTLGLGDKLHNRPNQLSGGQQQRVSIARALMNSGHIILADEPTGALDSHSGQEVMGILHRLKNQGYTIIMVTHDPNLAKQAQRVIELKDGCIIKDHYTEGQATAFDGAFFDGTLVHPVDKDDAHPKSRTPPPTSQNQDKAVLALPTSNLPNAISPNTIASKANNLAIRNNPLVNLLDRLKEAFKMSLFAMMAHKMRTLLTMLGIIIGIASVVSIVGLGQGSQAKILEDINALGTNTITIMNGYAYGDPRRIRGYQNLSTEDANAVAAQPYALLVSPQVDTSMTTRYKNIETTANINGVGQGYLLVTGESLSKGQDFTDTSITTSAQDIIIDEVAYQTFFEGIGNPIGETVMIGNIPAQVIGVLDNNQSGFGRASNVPQLYMPYTTVMHRMLGTNYIDRFVVLLDKDTSADIAENAISSLIESRHGTDDFTIMNTDSIRQAVESTTQTMTLLISSIAIISLVVGGIGVMNIMLVSVTERTNEIGVRMAVGARQSDIMHQFLIEAVLVCILGGVLGIVVAFGIGGVINYFAGDNFGVIYSPLSIVMAFVCSTMIGIIFGFLPARNAARLDPVQALNRN